MVWLLGTIAVVVVVAGCWYLRPHWLAQAVAAGDRRAVERLLRWGGSLDAPTPWGTSLLETAAIHQQPEMLDLLLKRGVSIPPGGGDRALRAAVMVGSSAMVERLLTAGATPSPFAVIATLAAFLCATHDADDRLAAEAVTSAELLWPRCPENWPQEPYLAHAERYAQQGHPELRDAILRLASA